MKLDISHLCTMYSILYNWCKIPHTDMMSLNTKQANYCREISDQLKWLQRMKMLTGIIILQVSIVLVNHGTIEPMC